MMFNLLSAESAEPAISNKLVLSGGAISAYECAYGVLESPRKSSLPQGDLLSQVENPSILMPPLTDRVVALLNNRTPRSA